MTEKNFVFIPKRQAFIAFLGMRCPKEATTPIS
jgi:hypothetical protein